MDDGTRTLPLHMRRHCLAQPQPGSYIDGEHEPQRLESGSEPIAQAEPPTAFTSTLGGPTSAVTWSMSRVTAAGIGCLCVHGVGQIAHRVLVSVKGYRESFCCKRRGGRMPERAACDDCCRCLVHARFSGNLDELR
jgi:hypothetical protein